MSFICTSILNKVGNQHLNRFVNYFMSEFNVIDSLVQGLGLPCQGR